MKINEKLKERRKELGLTMLEVANKVGVSEATVSRWESGDIANMRRDKIVLLAKALDVSPNFVMDEHTKAIVDEPYKNLPEPNITEDYATFPVIGEVAAGYEHVAVEDWEGDIVDIPFSFLHGRNKSDFFVLRVKGDSMYPQYQDGDKVLVLKQSTMDYSGQIGVVIYSDDKGTLKKVEYAQGEDWMRLIPINPSYPPTEITNENLEHCRVLGIPRLVLREVNQSVITKSNPVSPKKPERTYTSARFDDNEERIAAFGGIKEDDDTTYTT